MEYERLSLNNWMDESQFDLSNYFNKFFETRNVTIPYIKDRFLEMVYYLICDGHRPLDYDWILEEVTKYTFNTKTISHTFIDDDDDLK